MKKILLAVFLFALFLFLLSPQKIEAAFSFNIASSSATVITSGSQDIEVGLNILDLPSESYFRVSLQKESGGSYYGYVLNNNGDWAKIQILSGDCTTYYKVTDTSMMSLLLKYRIGDDTEIPNGNYNLKAHRFTKTCTSYTEATNFLSLEVSFTTPTPTPFPIATSTPEPTTTPLPTNTPVPTSTPTLRPTITPTSSPKPTPTQTPTPTLSAEESSISSFSGEVLGESEEKLTPTPSTGRNKKSGKLFSFIAIILGLGFIGASGYFFFKSPALKK